MTDDGGPRRISDCEVQVSITGYFMPTDAPDVPVLIGMPGTDDLFVLVFSTEQKLREAMKVFGISYARVSIITDGPEFLDGLCATNARGGRSYRFRVALDPHAAEGRVRFKEVVLDPPSQAPVSLSALATMKHAEGCEVVHENGVVVWMCVGTCPAMHEHLRSGQVDRECDHLDRDQVETVTRVVTDRLRGEVAKLQEESE